MQNPKLWARLMAYRIDDISGEVPFSVKLAQSEGWSREYADRVIFEYRRFLYLSQLSQMPVTPSKAIDRAWHLHLTYTREYWGVFCKDILQNTLHHDPSESVREMGRYEAQFANTYALYQEEFEAMPPEDIWLGKGSKTGACIGGIVFLSGLLLVSAATVLVWGRPVFVTGCLVTLLGAGIWLWASPDRGHNLHYRNGGGGGCGGGGCGG